MTDPKRSRSQKKKKSRDPNQKKKVIKGLKSLRGQPENSYGEIKKNKSFSLTDTGANLLKNLSAELNISTSELLERVARKAAEIKAILSSNSPAENSEDGQL